ncbi:MAG: response regulator transcription factor [Acidobacteriaceae bacterium]|jgi:DNA-binding response OmpR family regulator
MRILVIEDDLRMVELLRTGLWEHGHTIVTATTAEQGQQLVDAENFDAIVLDIGLPGRSGYTIAQHLRSRPNRPAIVMLTALNQEDQVVCGLDAGADDYLTKPFSFPELLARIGSAARRARIAATDDFCFGPFRLDTRLRRLLCNRVEVHITRSEYLLLRALAIDRGEVISRRQLMQAVWGTTIISHGALDTLVNTLREKLNVKQHGLISTARGIGYSMVEDADLY